MCQTCGLWMLSTAQAVQDNANLVYLQCKPARCTDTRTVTGLDPTCSASSWESAAWAFRLAASREAVMGSCLRSFSRASLHGSLQLPPHHCFAQAAGSKDG